MPHTQDPMLGLYRSATKPLADFTTLLLTCGERLQNAQRTSTQELFSSQRTMERQLQEAGSIHEAIDIQIQSGRESWLKFLASLNEINTASSINQMEWIRHNQYQALQMIDSIDSALDDIPSEVAPLIGTIKLSIGAIRTVYETNIRATEEAARHATARLESVASDASIVPSTRQAA